MNATSFTKTKTRTRAYTHLQHCSLNIHTNTALFSQLSSFFNSYLFLFSAVDTHSICQGYTLLLPSWWCRFFLSDCIISTCGQPVCSCLHAYASAFVTYTRELVPCSDFFQKFTCFGQNNSTKKSYFWNIEVVCKAAFPWSLWRGIFDALLSTVVAMTKTVKRKVEIEKETVNITNQKLQFEE